MPRTWCRKHRCALFRGGRVLIGGGEKIIWSNFSPDQDAGLWRGYIGGNRDPAPAAAFEHRLAADPGLRARHESLLSLRRLLHAVPRDDVPVDRLRSRIDAAVDRKAGGPPPVAPDPAPGLIGRLFGAPRPVRS